MRALANDEPSLSRVVSGATYVVLFARRAIETATGEEGDSAVADRVGELMRASTRVVARPLGAPTEGKVQLSKPVDVRAFIRDLVAGGSEVARVREHVGLHGDLVGVVADVVITPGGAVKAAEIAEALLPGVPHQIVRTRVHLDARAALVAPSLAPETASS